MRKSKGLKILALDPSTKCGFAHSDGTRGTWDLSIKRDESAGMRLIRLKANLNDILSKGCDLLVYEAARHAAPNMQGALVVQAAIQGVIVLWAEENKVEYRGYSPTEIKKHATGKGNAKKPDMMQAAKSKLNIQCKDDNECDALWLLNLADKTYNNRGN